MTIMTPKERVLYAAQAERVLQREELELWRPVPGGEQAGVGHHF
jgi:hypothetical protein